MAAVITLSPGIAKLTAVTPAVVPLTQFMVYLNNLSSLLAFAFQFRLVQKE